MIDIYLDTETTGIDPYNSEIIEAYFELYQEGVKVDSYYLKTQVDNWSQEAAEIHGIKENDMISYPKKLQAYTKLLTWLPTNFRFITYANKKTFYGCINFDVALLMNELDLLGYSTHYMHANYKIQNALSVHDLVKDMKKKIGIKGSLSQSNVYDHLFNEAYNAHNAQDDVHALVRIHKKLIELSNDDNSILTLC